ncbi:MAG: hypothetical protein J5701_04190 [Bacteroidales bacterium]|nr:hypothetical protein [Bacteroidales bacterium]
MKKIIFILICFTLCFAACDKEPSKGEYIGNFTGYITDTYDSIEYHSIYLFTITKSTAKEMVIQENSGKASSTLQKTEGDSVKGALGFANVMGGNDDSSRPVINMIIIQGKYSTIGNISQIEGTYQGRAVLNGELHPSIGVFTLKQSK